MKRMTVIISIVLAIAIVGVAFQITQAQRQQQPPAQRPGGARALQIVRQTWAGIAFEVKVDNATLEKARPHLQKAWDDQKKLIKDSADDFQAIADGMTKIKADLDEKLKTVLTEEQMKQLAEWEKSQQQTRRGGPMGGGSRGGGGGMR
jgi:transcription termination factor NusB